MAISRALLITVLLASGCGLPSQGGEVVEKPRPSTKTANVAAHTHDECPKTSLHGGEEEAGHDGGDHPEEHPEPKPTNKPPQPSGTSNEPSTSTGTAKPGTTPKKDCEEHSHALR